MTREPGARDGAATGAGSPREIGVVIVWVLLQLPRLIAISLLSDVVAGRESVAWLYPAIVDTGSAIAAPVVAYLLWRRRGPIVWTIAIVFLVACLFDAGNAVTVGLNAPTPAIFGGPDQGFIVYPILAGLIDAITLGVLMSGRVREYELGASRDGPRPARRS